MSHEQRGIFYGYFTASSNIGFIVGPACGGHLAELPNGFFLVTTTASAIFVLNAGKCKLLQVRYLVVNE